MIKSAIVMFAGACVVATLISIGLVQAVNALTHPRPVTWTNNKTMDTPTVSYAKHVFLAGTNMTVELGMRSDGVVVWRKVQE